MSHSTGPKKLPQVVQAIFGSTIENKTDRTTERTNVDRTSEEAFPAVQLHRELQFVFQFLNAELFFPIFGVRLPDVMFTVVRSRRFAGAFCYRTYERNKTKEADISEIIVNPLLFSSPVEVLQTLAHEMVHLAQFELEGAFGEPSERGYHNRKFSNVMRLIGLRAVNIDDLSRNTGYRMTDIVIDGGAFENVRQRYVESGGTISWAAINDEERGASAPANAETIAMEARKLDAKRKRASKTPIVCPNCTQRLWGKPSAFAICGFCNVRMISLGANPATPPAA